MKHKKTARVLSLVIAVMMILTTLPLSALADGAKQTFEKSQLSLVTDKSSTLAKGVNQDIYTVYDKNGDQVKMFVATVDMSVDTVKLYTAYKNMDNNSYGMSKLTEQVAAFNEKVAAGDEYYQGTVVAGINASYYNMTTGKPTGVFVMNGNDVTGNEKSDYFAVLKDGSVKIGRAADYAADKGNIAEAVSIYTMLVFDNNIVLNDSQKNDAKKYPRQTIGITADNKVILLTADGNQEPESIGLTLLEQAQVMMDLGCVWAGHLDGGGSATYGSKPEGQDKFVITNKPSDGSERSISNGFIVVSTEAASKAFDHAVITPENEYVTPGTSVAFSVAGVSSTGNAAEIPENIVYSAEKGSVENGVYTASATAGTDTVTAYVDGKAVGSAEINVVVPNKLVFNSDKMTVPYGKTVAISLTATYGLNEVKIKAEDIQFTLENSDIGTIDGFLFTAGDGGVESSKITAALIGTDISAESEIKLGRGSEVIFDFEDGNTDEFTLGYSAYNYTLPEGKVYPVTAETGKVHSGNGAMALDINYGNSTESGYMMTALAYLGETKQFKDAKTLGMWMYISDEDVSTWIRYTVFPLVLNDAGEYVSATTTITNTLADGKASTTGFVNQYQEPGWHYLTIDLSAYKGLSLNNGYYMMQFYISDRDGSAYDYYYNQHKSYNGRYVMYVDDITIDYSDAVDDREAPVFGDVTYASSSMSDAVVLNGQTVTDNTISFGVKVADNTDKSNYTGLDENSVKAYIDGNEVPSTVKNGVVSVTDAVLADGLHHIKFSACDKQGNYASVIREITVNANSGKPTVKVVAHDPSLDKIKLGSVWYADIVATDIEKVQSVTTDIDLNNMSRWELDHMDVAEGFEATYSIQDDENIATVTVTRTGENNSTGEAVLVSMPIRTWELKMGYTYTSGTKKGKTAYTYNEFKNMKEFWPVDISMEIDRGVLTLVDGTVDFFSGKGPQVDTESYKMAKDMISTAEGLAYYNAWDGGHIHTAEAVADKAATCTQAGYTGRTYCEVCHSVVDWGTTVPAKGHTFELGDGVLSCGDCGILFNGEWTDGKTYTDGVVANGWNGNKYYTDGRKAIGITLIDGVYYNFDESGDSLGKYTGLVKVDGNWCYSKVGVLTGGWVQIDGNWHCFYYSNNQAITGTRTLNGVTYEFDEKGMTSGAWSKTAEGTRYYYSSNYYVARETGYMTLVEIDGKTYNFDHSGYITTGIQVLRDSTSFKKYAFEFDENGALVRRINEQGTVEAADGTYYINEEGYVPMNAGLVKSGNDYYYVVYSGKVKKDADVNVTEDKANGLLSAGTYKFGADGKLIDEKNGIFEINGDYYYKVNGVIQKDLGLIKIDGDYYFVCYSGKLKIGTKGLTAAMTNGLLPAGTYKFGADGKLEFEKDGIYKVGDDYYYKVNGVIQKDLGLIKIDGDYYFVCYSGKLKIGTKGLTAAMTNGLLPAGVYTFGADGKLMFS